MLLALTALARRRAVVIARSQLVEIGGGFRVPDVMKQSGARLLEVGATNRVHLSDYEAALEEKPALFLRAHRSNFRISGFTSEPELAEIAALAKRCGHLPAGRPGLRRAARYERASGWDTSPWCRSRSRLAPTWCVSPAISCWAGRRRGSSSGVAALVDRLKKHPLARAVRADKLCLAALSATLLHYIKDEAEREIPIWRMIAAPLDEIERRARRLGNRPGAGRGRPGRIDGGRGILARRDAAHPAAGAWTWQAPTAS